MFSSNYTVFDMLAFEKYYDLEIQTGTI